MEEMKLRGKEDIKNILTAIREYVRYPFSKNTNDSEKTMSTQKKKKRDTQKKGERESFSS